ncbi:hypothetical protein [Streptomyces sp. NPDC006925]|uniref:hypothetical protein n=1 Tax=Streptomyces sp. NPDC006925 TaxID=3364768 RepID=UPI0036914341
MRLERRLPLRGRLYLTGMRSLRGRLPLSRRLGLTGVGCLRGRLLARCGLRRGCLLLGRRQRGRRRRIPGGVAGRVAGRAGPSCLRLCRELLLTGLGPTGLCLARLNLTGRLMALRRHRLARPGSVRRARLHLPRNRMPRLLLRRRHRGAAGLLPCLRVAVVTPRRLLLRLLSR